MADMQEYQRLGDLDAPFGLTAKHKRLQQDQERMHEALRCDVSSLTYEQYQAGSPCPGCGRPYHDAEPWEFRGLIHMTPEERDRYDAERDQFTSIHHDCGSYRHSVAGSLTMHCGRCCPSPPMSPSKAAEIRSLLTREPTPPHQLMRWRLRLYCGHVAESAAHYTHKTLHGAFIGTIACPECGLDPATIVDGVAIGLAGEPPTPVAPIAPAKPPRAALEARVRELEAEVDRLRRRDPDSNR